MRLFKIALLTSLSLLFVSTSFAAEKMMVKMKDLKTDKYVGYVEITQTPYGIVLTPSIKVKGAKSSMHGFHVHQNASCDSSMKDGKKILGGAAGGHYDPMNTAKHGFPWTQDNHLGDLPAIYFNRSGMARYPVLAPRLKMSDLKNRALMIHMGGDNYSDKPKALGGGGARMICGVIMNKANKM